MKLRIVTIFFLIISPSLLFAQASWGYSIKFKLISKENDTITIENFKNGKIKLFSHPFGAYSDNKLQFDALSNTFIFSQNTITTGSILVFQTSNDITTLNIQTTNMDLKTIKLTGNSYFFRVWNNEEKFIKNNEKDKYWKLKYPLETYTENGKKLIIKNLEALIEVKIK